MRKIFEEYGGVIVTVIAVVALIGLVTLLMQPGSVMEKAFSNIVQSFVDKTEEEVGVSAQPTWEDASASGAYIAVSDVSSTPHNLKVSLSSDSITDFSSVNVTRYGSNLIDASQLANENTTVNGDGTYTLTKTSSNRFTNYCDVDIPAGVPFVIRASIVENTTAAEVAVYAEIVLANGTKDYTEYITGNNGSLITKQYDQDVEKIRIFVRDDVVNEGEYITFKELQVCVGETLPAYEDYVAPQSVTANADGTVDGLTSTAPGMTLIADNGDVAINCDYKKKL